MAPFDNSNPFAIDPATMGIRRRGRPRKLEATIAAEPTMGAPDVSGEPIQNRTEGAVRSAEPMENMPLSSDTHPATAPVKRGRGRPRKATPSAEPTTPVPSSVETFQPAGTEDVPEPVQAASQSAGDQTPRKRGRPRKAIHVAEPNAAVPSSVETFQPEGAMVKAEPIRSVPPSAGNPKPESTVARNRRLKADAEALSLDERVARLIGLNRNYQFYIRQKTAATNSVKALVRLQVGFHPQAPKSAERDAAEAVYEDVLAALEGETFTTAIASETFLGLQQAYATQSIYLDALETRKADLGKQIEIIADTLPGIAFVGSVKGFGLKSFGQLVAEAGRLDRFDNPAKLWKRMGLSVADGRAEKLKAGENTGYCARRRSLMYVLSEGIMKLGDAHYRPMYDAKKAEYVLKSEMKIDSWTTEMAGWKARTHNAALRYMVKKVLRDLWVAWRKDTGQAAVEMEPVSTVP